MPRKKPQREATPRSPYHGRWACMGLHQLRSAVQSMGHIARTPVHSIMTILVVGITLAMPLGLSVLLSNLQSLSPSWQQQTPISVYLKTNVSQEAAEHMMAALAQNPVVADVHYITPEEGLERLKSQAGFGEVLDTLSENPLPGLIVITPKENMADATTDNTSAHPFRLANTPPDLDSLMRHLEDDPAVDKVKMDWRWIKRLQATFALAQQAVWLLACLLSAGVLLIIGNVIALTMQKYRQDMRTYQLLGASDHFIRQPFLYMGAWIGALGSLCAWGLINLGIHSLQPAVDALAIQYDTSYTLTHVVLSQGLRAVAVGALLGVLGAYLAVSRYLSMQQED